MLSRRVSVCSVHKRVKPKEKARNAKREKKELDYVQNQKQYVREL